MRDMLALVLPSAELSAADAGVTPHLICHTNCPDVVEPRIPEGWTYELRGVGPETSYVALQRGHADAVASAEVGDYVLLLNADLVVSVNLIRACAAHFERGARAVVLTGIRTTKQDETPPMGATPRALLEWAWHHRHRIIRDLEWGSGRSMLPTNVFFERGGAVCARGFHLHPVAIVKQEATAFQSTIDGDLLDCFDRAFVHVVTDPDDCAMLEVSPEKKRFPVGQNVMTPSGVAKSMLHRASDTHKWLFTHRLGVVGNYDGDEDERVAAEVLDFMAGAAGAIRNERRQRGREAAGRIGSGVPK